jgi:hypothetical protein
MILSQGDARKGSGKWCTHDEISTAGLGFAHKKRLLSNGMKVALK